MTDFFVKAIPLPIPRPSGLFSEYQPTVDAGRALQASRELADAFSEGGWYTPTSQHTKPLYGLLIESSAFWWFWGILIVVGYTAYRFQRWRKLGI